ncbi:hypothetical protein BJ138DRAFT_1112625 [Hygrophoropsis aurantiaca]|uniref:Uncharacterized protein n=1 Tax=Hygrophoropsis aurantiaca TaxID=72124 RepID=A0ACB8AG06_9AGAM|nr:hypothetical protein BJ138DRAFT_1112625 [Hygrophoropsis aurantiaca]
MDTPRNFSPDRLREGTVMKDLPHTILSLDYLQQAVLPLFGLFPGVITSRTRCSILRHALNIKALPQRFQLVYIAVLGMRQGFVYAHWQAQQTFPPDDVKGAPDELQPYYLGMLEVGLKKISNGVCLRLLAPSSQQAPRNAEIWCSY